MKTASSIVFRPAIFLIIALAISLAGLGAIMAMGVKIGVLILVALVGIPVVILSFKFPLFSLYSALISASFIFLIMRVTGMFDFPFGLSIDIALLIGTIGILSRKEKLGKNFFNPITISYFITIIYVLLQVANPTAHGLKGWLVLGIRSVVFDVCIFLVCYYAIRSFKDIKALTITFLAICIAAGLYGVYQEFIVLPNFDYKWITADPMRYSLSFIAGRLRKWSFFSNVSSFGVVMAYASLIAVVLCLGKIGFWARAALLAGTIFMLMGMGYSGTRTAYVMVPIGFAFYALLTINKPSTILASIAGFFLLAFILFGPVSGGTISRLRTAFEPSEDPSYQVREAKLASLRPYLWSHPLGGGIGCTLQGATYHPGHRLAGFSPDSGYLFTGLEKGWIGLILLLVMNYFVLSYGARAYFSMHDPSMKNYMAAMMTAYFAIAVGHISQNAMGYLPANIYNIVIMVSMFLLPQFDKQKSESYEVEN